MKATITGGIVALSLALACAPLALAGPSSSDQVKSHSAQAQAAQQMAGYRDWTTQKMRRVQKALIEHGADIEATGHWNDETRAAVKTFQKDNGLNVTGFPNLATVAALGVNKPK